MGVLSADAIAKVSGPAWEKLKQPFIEISNTLLSVSDSASGELTTIYVKFHDAVDSESRVYAVVWVKTSKELVVGLAMPEEFQTRELTGPSPGYIYKGLTKFFKIVAGQPIPTALREWAVTAH